MAVGLPTALALATLAAVHLLVPYLTFLRAIPRSRWLSAAGGASVAYVFLHLFPELATSQVEHAAEHSELAFVDRHIYAAALLGLAIFYGLERFIRSSGRGRERTRAFWLHLGSFAAYNMLVGYLLIRREQEGLSELAFYALAMALHFMTNDFGLRQNHGVEYDARGRWLLAGATVLGGGVGLLIAVPATLQHFLFAMLAGGVVLNVLKEELPEERQSRFGAFAIGAGAYGLVVLIGL